MITHEDAMALLLSKNPEPSLLRHSLETKAVMQALAQKLGHDASLWGLCGLLHDIDFPETAQDAARHGLPAREILSGLLPAYAVDAVVSHNYENNGAPPPADALGWALRCGETVTGLVFANAMVRPEGYAGMTPKSLRKKMKEKSFAANVNRDTILECERLGLTLDDFFQTAIQAMAEAAPAIDMSVKSWEEKRHGNLP